jgi:HK97 family phage major capsid protein
MTLLQMEDGKDVREKRMNEIIALGEKEKRDLSADEQNELDTLEEEIEDLKNQIEEKKRSLKRLTKKRDENPKDEENKGKRYGLIDAINDVISHRNTDELAEFNESGKQEFRNSGLGANGHIILPMQKRTISAGVATKGIEVIPEDKFPIVEALRAKSVLVAAGAQYLQNLTGDVSIPVYSGSNVGWAGEIAAAAAGDGTFAEVVLKPKRLTAYLDISKMFLIQSQDTAEALLMSDLVKAVTEKLESTLLGGAAGTATQPAGIFSLITPTSLTPDWAEIVALESALELNKVSNNIKFLASPSVKAALKTTPKDTGSGLFIWDANGIDGNVAMSSGNVLTDSIVCGDFSEFLIGQWGAIDITVDTVTQAVNGCIRLVINSYWDGKPRRNTSFVTAEL